MHLFLEQRRRKQLRVERLQIIRLFADADEFDGQAEFLLKRDDHAAFARAVEFGDDETREFHRFVKFTRLVQGVHAGGAVEHQQDFMRRAGEFPGHHAMQFLQFLHQIVFGVHPPRRIDEQVIGFARQRCGDGIVRDGGGVSAVIAGDNRHFQPLAPEFELFDRGGAEGVARGEQRDLSACLEPMRELGAGRGFSRAVDTHDREHRRAMGFLAQRRLI